jgi:uncharacterized membrane protein
MKDSTMTTRVEPGSRIARTNGNSLGAALLPQARPEPTEAARTQRLADKNRGTGGESLANFLGFFSLGLGLAQVIAPKTMSRVVGVKKPQAVHCNTMRLCGAREISTGIAILSTNRPAKAVWARVAGDAVDVALLGKTIANPENDRGRTTLALVNVLAVGALDVMCAKQLSSQPRTAATEAADRGILRARRSITIGRPVEEVYGFWRQLENLPLFMRHLESVEVIDERRSHWVARGPAGKSFEWDAEIVDDRPLDRISWRSLPGADVHNAGTVRFVRAPGRRGTEVHVDMEYRPPFGKLGSKIASLWREEPRQQVADDLRHLKQVLEIGEIVVSDASKQRGLHPAQPDGRGIRI